MNPSASGWIKKHLPIFQQEIIAQNYTEEQFYRKLKTIGFIYANSISTLSYPDGTTYQLTLEEISKINLFDSLGYVYFQIHPQAEHPDFINSVIAFYDYLKEHSWFNFSIPFVKSSADAKLEKIITKRVQLNASALEKNFSSLISNALLYLDVLTYKHYLETQESNPVDFAKSLEALLANTVYLAFKKKTDKTTHEKLVLKLLETSIRYNKIEEVSLPYEKLNYRRHQAPLECLYIIDLACMTTYSDELIEEKEQLFIQKLGKKLGFPENKIQESVTDINTFIKDHKGNITYLDYSNPFRNLYDNTSRMVKNLVLRNKKRLTKEISQSGELVRLLRKSTSSDLSEEEKAVVKTQLLDICKVVPSLAIFMLPGGSILLPILIKFIPDLLPSAFSDNK